MACMMIETVFGRWRRAGLLAIALLAVGGCGADDPGNVRTLMGPGLASADLSRVAVVVVDTTDTQRYRSAVTKAGTLGEVEKRFASALTARGYTVATGNAAEMAAARVDLNKSLDNKGVVQVGLAANVPAVLLVRITQYSRADQPAQAPVTPPPAGGFDAGNRMTPDKSVEPARYLKQYQVTAAITARLISVPAGEDLWTGWDSRSADHLEDEEDGGVLNQTCDGIGQALPVRPTPHAPATTPANAR